MRGCHLVSIADGALAELALALIRGSIPVEQWKARIASFDDVLDPNSPVSPGGRELAACWGAQSLPGFDRELSQAYYKAAWIFLRSVTRAQDLERVHVFHGPSGARFKIQLDRKHAEAAIAQAGAHWQQWVDNTADIIRSLREGGDKITESVTHDLTYNNLAFGMGLADAAKLELVTQVLSKRAMQAALPKNAYNPKGKPNDALDLDLLFAIPLPAWICTADEKLLRFVRSTKSSDRFSVMTPAELLDRLNKEIEQEETP